MKPVLRRAAAFLSLLVLASVAAQASPPTLEPINPNSYTQESRPGESRAFDVKYTQAEGDPPKSLSLILETPGGQVTEHASAPAGDPTKGIPVTWSYTPANSGTYRFHFEAVSSTGESARLPASPEEDYEFASVNPLTKMLIFVAGLVVAFVILPFVVYMGARGVNRRGDPAAAARVGLFVGVLASLGLYIYLFAADYGALGIAIACVAALAILIVLFSRRRAV
ncbi:MAG: hypothetical protein JO250_01830 [Armatimonadetes bacterium]|nr:hypothetical protein [Armatimonadota bacterium]